MPRSHQSRSLWRLLLPLLVTAVYLGGGCNSLRDTLGSWVDKTFGGASPRQEYVWSKPFPEQTMAAWDTAYYGALADSLRVRLPHREDFVPDTAISTSAHAMHLRLPPGRVLTVSLQQRDTLPVFVELYRDAEGEPEMIVSQRDDEVLTYETNQHNGEALLLVVQATPYRQSPYSLSVATRPALLFPVAGKDEGAIRSFWGASRDGGRRSHEGNDIFADRGTPLLAVVDGRVSRVRNGGLGGKTIWLRDPERGLSYYYAHLDRQLVSAGQPVNRGDTIGLVGNTGNARSTPPHLHFGIYRQGARDPLPYLQDAQMLPEEPYTIAGQRSRVPQVGTHYLRFSPVREQNVIRRLDGGESLLDLSTTGRFHRVMTGRGEIGFVNFD